MNMIRPLHFKDTVLKCIFTFGFAKQEYFRSQRPTFLICVVLGIALLLVLTIETTLRAAELHEIPSSLVEQLTIPSDGTVIESVNSLALDTPYLIVITGTYRYDVGEPGEFADAQYREDDNDRWTIRWNSVEFDGVGLPATNSNLENHTYRYYVTGRDRRIKFRIYDLPEEYGDNEGSLAVMIYSLSSPIDSTVIPASGLVVSSTIPLEANFSYLAIVTGTYRYDVGEPGEFADAQYREDDNDRWTIRWNSVEFNTARLNAAFFDQEQHSFTFYITGHGQPMTYRIYDDPGAYGDNEGSLTVRLFSLPDVTSPNGYIVSPSQDSTIDVIPVVFAAEALDAPANNSGINRVEFHIYYDGQWHNAGIDTTLPYNVTWEPSGLLHSQQLKFAINVIDNAENITINAGGIRSVNFIENVRDPSIIENWVPSFRRAYLNQRSLPSGDVKCSVSSMAMVLAMNGFIASDYSAMATKANEMYPKVAPNGTAYVGTMRKVLRSEGALSDYYEETVDEAWDRIKLEVDAGRPVIVRTVHGIVTAQGHILVAVGYRENGVVKQIIAYDPFGRWKGTCCAQNYDLNATSSSSRKGAWVYYDFGTIFGAKNYLITASNPNPEAILSATSSVPSTPPDPISDEPENIGTYEGVPVEVGSEVFLPVIAKN
jgi:hypothetical protein